MGGKIHFIFRNKHNGIFYHIEGQELRCNDSDLFYNIYIDDSYYVIDRHKFVLEKIESTPTYEYDCEEMNLSKIYNYV